MLLKAVSEAVLPIIEAEGAGVPDINLESADAKPGEFVTSLEKIVREWRQGTGTCTEDRKG